MPANPTTATLVGDFVAANPGTARVLEAHGVDYCCGGQRPLADACADGGLDADALLAELTAVPATNDDDLDVSGLSNADLIDHIVAVHHDYLWREMPRLSELANKVARVHGANHPELRAVQQAWTQLVAELTDHLMTEEQEQFPAIRRAGEDGSPFSGSVDELLREHDAAGQLLARLRELTNGFTVPGDGCASYRALFAGLEDTEADLHTHIHKENNILFPRLAA